LLDCVWQDAPIRAGELFRPPHVAVPKQGEIDDAQNAAGSA
jgi:hypothetical protein